MSNSTAGDKNSSTSSSFPTPIDSPLEEERIKLIAAIGACDEATLDEISIQYRDNCGRDPDEELRNFGYTSLKDFLESATMSDAVCVEYGENLRVIYALKPDPRYDHLREVCKTVNEQIIKSKQMYGSPVFRRQV